MNTQKVSAVFTVAQLKAALIFMPKHDIRYYLKGACVRHTEKGTQLIASDGSRLIVIRVDSIAAPKLVEYIIPRALVESAIKVYGKAAGIEVVYDGSAVKMGELSGVVVHDKFPDVSRVVPSKVSGEIAQYAWSHLADCNKASALLKDRRNAECPIGFNGSGPCLVELTDQALAVVMPMRGDGLAVVPSWY